MPAACPTCTEDRQHHLKPCCPPQRQTSLPEYQSGAGLQLRIACYSAAAGKGARAQMTVRPMTRGSDPFLHLITTPSLSTLDTCRTPQKIRMSRTERA